ncbi:hypothetical protein [Moritella viscosa]|uniref:Ribosome maturation factor rimM n=1 Tax=Moritella viscosa TaxID=80854 RepID=A0A090IKH8_9GAMM|nr:hypothetical protein [Moritella viscosa]CED60799.1 putative uncharacterized protein [Moritella viscosa]SGZ08865.1 Ribosome maturation factor rimM [Moritella viscosa]SHO15848.1 Ribosome maturation factor rimM [Moritella viscosa]
MKGIHRKEFVHIICTLISNHEYIFGAVSIREDCGYLICIRDYVTQNIMFMADTRFRSRSDALYDFGLMWDDALAKVHCDSSPLVTSG